MFTTKYQKVRIYKVNRVSQTSRRWLADPANRLCAPGEWYCPGQYPPEIAKLLPAKMLPKNVSTGTGKRI